MKAKGFSRSEIECRERFLNKLDPEIKKDTFGLEELKKLFDLYDEYGGKWSEFEELIPGRTQSLLKNKFHSTIRTVCRLIIASCGPQTKNKTKISSGTLSSNCITDLYEGKKTLKKYKGIMKKILIIMDYEPSKEGMEKCKEIIGREILERVSLYILENIKTKKGEIKPLDFPNV